MPDVGDLVAATLTVTPFDGTTSAALVAYRPDGSTATVSGPTSSGGGATWTATYTTDVAGWWLLKWTVTGTGSGIEYQRVFVPVVPTYGDAPAYASVETLRRTTNITAADSDDLLADAVDSASREIDNFCGRRFYADTAATARVYTPRDPCLVYVDDFYTTTGLVVKVDFGGNGTYGTTWTQNTHFVLEPTNGIVDGAAGWPFWRMRTIGGNRFPCFTMNTVPSVQVTAKWGWASIPRPVTQACLIMARANYKLKDVAFGAAGIGELGIVTIRQNPAAMTKLAPYVREPVMVA